MKSPQLSAKENGFEHWRKHGSIFRTTRFSYFSFRTPSFTYFFFPYAQFYLIFLSVRPILYLFVACKAETASMSALDRVEEVLIDEGVFKYVYIRVYQDAGKDDR